MTIDDAIETIEYLKTQNSQLKSLDVAISTMRKYQKIEEIVNNYINSGKPYISVIDEDIKEVLEDEKGDKE